MMKSYSTIYDIKKFAMNEIAPKYLNIDEVNDLNVGLLGFVTEYLGTIAEDTFNATTLYLNEMFPHLAKMPETIYNNATLFKIDGSFAKASNCKVYLFVPIQAIELYAVHSNNSDIHEFYIDSNMIIDIEGYTFMPDYDIKIKYKNVRGLNDKIYTAEYVMQRDNSPYINSISNIITPNIKLKRIRADNAYYLQLEIDVHQVEKFIQEETVTTNSIITSPKIIVNYDGQLANFEIFYKEPTSQSYIQLKKQLFGLPPIETDKFCYYKIIDEGELEISFTTRDDNFQPEYGSNLLIEYYTTLGYESNFDKYSEASTTVYLSSNKYIYNNNITLFAIPVSPSVDGMNSLELEDLKRTTVEMFSTVNSYTTENDLQLYFNNYNETNNSNILFTKIRDDIFERRFSAGTLFKDSTNGIFSTNTLDVLGISPGTNDSVSFDFDINLDSSDILVLKPGHLFTYNDYNIIITHGGFDKVNKCFYCSLGENSSYTGVSKVFINNNEIKNSYRYIPKLQRVEFIDLNVIAKNSVIEFIYDEFEVYTGSQENTISIYFDNDTLHISFKFPDNINPTTINDIRFNGHSIGNKYSYNTDTSSINFDESVINTMLEFTEIKVYDDQEPNTAIMTNHVLYDTESTIISGISINDNDHTIITDKSFDIIHKLTINDSDKICYNVDLENRTISFIDISIVPDAEIIITGLVKDENDENIIRREILKNTNSNKINTISYITNFLHISNVSINNSDMLEYVYDKNTRELQFIGFLPNNETELIIYGEVLNLNDLYNDHLVEIIADGIRGRYDLDNYKSLNETSTKSFRSISKVTIDDKPVFEYSYDTTEHVIRFNDIPPRNSKIKIYGKSVEFIYTNPFLTYVKTLPTVVGYYLNSVDSKHTLYHTHISDDSLSQFVCGDLRIFRNALIGEDLNKYTITVRVTPTSTPHADIIREYDDVMKVLLGVRLFFMDTDGVTKLGYIDMELDKDQYNPNLNTYVFKCKILTDDKINKDSKFHVINVNSLNPDIDPELYVPMNNSILMVQTLYDVDGVMKPTNEYTTELDPVTFITPMDIIHSTGTYVYAGGGEVNTETNEIVNGNYKINISQVPLIDAELLNIDLSDSTYKESDKYLKSVEFFEIVKSEYDYISTAMDKITNNFSIDVKFFNSFGYSNNFYIDIENKKKLDKVNINIKFQINFVYGYDTDLAIQDVKIFIKDYIERINESGTNSIYISNLIRELENNFTFINYLKFVNINDYDSEVQTIENLPIDLSTLSKHERLKYIPEYLTISLDDIEIEVI